MYGSQMHACTYILVYIFIFRGQYEKNLSGETSSTGGWCAQTSVENSGKHKRDTKLAPILAQFLKGHQLLVAYYCKTPLYQILPVKDIMQEYT